MNIDEMGVGYSVYHAAVLAEQLPAGARVNGVDGLRGLTTTELLLNQIEFNGRVLAWQKTKDAQHGRNKPHPLIDVSKSESRTRGRAMDIDQLETLLKRNRREVEGGR